MSTRVKAATLAVGDVFVQTTASLGPRLYQVTDVRTLRTVETYTVVEATHVGTGNRMQINLLRRLDPMVDKLEPIAPRDVRNLALGLTTGNGVSIWRGPDGGLYA